MRSFWVGFFFSFLLCCCWWSSSFELSSSDRSDKHGIHKENLYNCLTHVTLQDKKSTEQQHTRKREGHRDTQKDTQREREDGGSCNQTERSLKLDLQYRAWRDQGREASKERRQPATKISHNYSTNDLRNMEEKQTSSREEEERDREGGGKCLPNTQKNDSSAARRERERERRLRKQLAGDQKSQ
jgi:hypothetical protein